MSNIETFNLGDQVTTKAYAGPLMAVIGIDGETIECRWREKRKFCVETFNAAELTHDTDPPPPFFMG